MTDITRTIQADGKNHTVTTVAGDTGTITLNGHLDGSLTVVGHGDVHALRAGDGNGNAIRSGSGNGDAIRAGSGYGNARRSGSGDGYATRSGRGHGNALRDGDGDGDATRAGSGHGDATRAGDGNGYAIRDSAAKTAAAKAYKAAHDQREKLQGEIDVISAKYEATNEAADRKHLERTNTIREYYTQGPTVDANCALPNPMYGLLANSVRDANAYATGELGADMPNPTPAAKPRD